MQFVKRLFAPRDLTLGSPARGILLFAIPLLIGNFAQQLYNTVDAIVVGHYISDAALGAVGLTGPILNLMLVLFMGISTGASIVVSQYFGAKNREDLSRAVGSTIVLTFWSGVIITVLGVAITRPLLVLLGTPAEMLDLAVDYLVIIFLGITACAYYNILSGVLRGLGDSVSPLLYLLLAAGLNIVLDILSVRVLGMKTDGVAWATIISQAISAVLCYRRLRRMTEILEVSRRTLHLDKPSARRIMSLGLPSGVAQMVFSISSVLVQSLTNTLGPNVVTASTAVMRVDGFTMLPNFTFAIAATTFTGQNVGARRMDRVRQGMKATLAIGLSTATFLTVCILLFGGGLMRVFTQTQEIVELGVSMMRILAIGYIAFCCTQVLMGVMRGAGETLRPMWISLITTVGIRMPVAYLWAYLTRSPQYPNGDPICLYGSLLVAWLLGCAMTVAVYRRGSWKKKYEAMPEGIPINEDFFIQEGGF
ncbi:MAG: MATE family efflux transporter [Candidatus Limiplasma sp.]|nr:MATE family efflux transporter [Candidatus Limiplasma sp.]